MKPRIPRERDGLARRTKLAMGLAITMLTACSTAITADPAPATPASIKQSADEVSIALSEVSDQLSDQLEADTDLTLAWTDFERDVLSVVEDLIRKPSRVDIDGMQQRIEALGNLLDDSPVELPTSQWEQFVSTFATLVEEANESGGSA